MCQMYFQSRLWQDALSTVFFNIALETIVRKTEQVWWVKPERCRWYYHVGIWLSRSKNGHQGTNNK